MRSRAKEQPKPGAREITAREKTDRPQLARDRPLVFISHDSGDADLAEAFGNLLTDVSAGMLASFRASDRKGMAGIGFGEEWYNAIMSRLDEATDVVALLTRTSMERPWILYEAGVAKGKLGTKVFGLLVGMPLSAVSTGPFAQFQNSEDDEDSITKLVLQLVARIPGATPREEAVRRQVAVFREQLSTILGARGELAKPDAEPPVDLNAIARLFEEVKVMLRDLPDDVRGRRRRLHPMMFEEVLHFAGRHGGLAYGWLMFISMLREECPWAYEIGMDVYRALREGDRERASEGVHRMAEMASVMMHGPWAESMLGDSDFYMVLRHLPEMFEPYLGRAEGGPSGRGRGRRSQEEGKPP
jgi:hypothetical protein